MCFSIDSSSWTGRAKGPRTPWQMAVRWLFEYRMQMRRRRLNPLMISQCNKVTEALSRTARQFSNAGATLESLVRTYERAGHHSELSLRCAHVDPLNKAILLSCIETFNAASFQPCTDWILQMWEQGKCDRECLLGLYDRCPAAFGDYGPMQYLGKPAATSIVEMRARLWALDV